MNNTPKKLSYRSYMDSVRHLYDMPVAQASTTLILTILTIVFFGLAAIRPSLGIITTLQAEIREKREIDSQLSTKVSSLLSIQDEYRRNSEVLSVFDQALPDNQDLERLILSVEYLASRNQVQLLGLRTSNLTVYSSTDEHLGDGEDFPAFSIDTNVGGSYGDLLELLDQLQNLDRYMVIERVSFNQPGDEANFDLNMSFRAQVYWAPEE